MGFQEKEHRLVDILKIQKTVGMHTLDMETMEFLHQGIPLVYGVPQARPLVMVFMGMPLRPVGQTMGFMAKQIHQMVMVFIQMVMQKCLGH